MFEKPKIFRKIYQICCRARSLRSLHQVATLRHGNTAHRFCINGTRRSGVLLSTAYFEAAEFSKMFWGKLKFADVVNRLQGTWLNTIWRIFLIHLTNILKRNDFELLFELLLYSGDYSYSQIYKKCLKHQTGLGFI